MSDVTPPARSDAAAGAGSPRGRPGGGWSGCSRRSAGRPAPVARAGRAGREPARGGAGQHGAQRCPQDDPGRPRGDPGRAGLGDQRVLVGLRRAAVHVGRARRPLRPSAHPGAGPCAVRDRLVAVRVRPDADPADRGARIARDRWRLGAAGDPVDHHRHLPAAGTRPGHRDLGGRGRRGGGDRSAARWVPPGALLVGLGVPDQRPDRGGRRGRDPDERSRVAKSAPRTAGPRRTGAVGAGSPCPGVRDPGGRLGRAEHLCVDRGRRAGAGGLPVLGGAHRPPLDGPEPVPDQVVLRAPGGDGADVRSAPGHVALPGVLLPGGTRLVAAAVRGADPAVRGRPAAGRPAQRCDGCALRCTPGDPVRPGAGQSGHVPVHAARPPPPRCGCCSSSRSSSASAWAT